MDSMEGLATILKGEAGRWEDVIFRWACDLARKAAEYLLQRIDQDLMKGREGGLRMGGRIPPTRSLSG